jgi:osmotically-inducible protein OsmY
MQLLALGALLGAAITYLFDPQNGRRRRAMLRDRSAAFARQSGRRTADAGRAVAAEAHGVSQKARHLKEEPKEYDDATLAQKVQSEIFRDADAPKGQVDVNAEDGIVVLRGEVERPELIDDLVEKTRKVEGVRDVQNLLHLPGTPAPTEAVRGEQAEASG